MATETPVTFDNRRGDRLFGVLHTPEGAPGDLVLMLLSPGVKMRVGPQGLYRRMADEFVAMGISVLRFDFHGLGDSAGTLPEELLRDVYNHIEVGRYVEDTVDAMNWMEQRYGSRRFILSGLCGGAITGLLAGEHDSRVAGLIGLGITPVLAARSADASRYMTTGQLQDSQKRYLKRLLSPKAWYRLLTFQTDNRLIGRMLSLWWRRLLGTPEPVAVAPPADDNANPRFPPAYFRMLATRRPMLLVFGGADRLRWEFEEKFVQRHKERLAALPALSEVHIVDLANHVLSLREWQRELLDVSNRWMHTHFAQDLKVRQPAGAERA